MPRVVGPIRRTRPVEVRDVEFLRSITDRRIKITVPGPFTMTQQAQNDHYADERSLALAYAEAVNEELRDLKAAGADVVQIDEPYLQARPEAAREYAVEAINRALDGIDGDDGAAHVLRLRAHRPRPADRATRSWRSCTTAARRTSRSRRRSRDLDPERAARRCRTRRSCSACSTWARPRSRRPRSSRRGIRRALEVVPPSGSSSRPTAA